MHLSFDRGLQVMASMASLVARLCLAALLATLGCLIDRRALIDVGDFVVDPIRKRIGTHAPAEGVHQENNQENDCGTSHWSGHTAIILHGVASTRPPSPNPADATAIVSRLCMPMAAPEWTNT